jgi:hypothetical protein
MRKFFYGLGVVVAVLAVAGAVGLFVLARNGSALDAESRAYVDESIVTIGGHWDVGELWQRSTPHFREITKQEDLRAFFDAAKGALGPLVEYRGARGEAMISVTPAGTKITGQYVAGAKFEKGNADVQIAAVKNGSTWGIEGFHIQSSTLMRGLVGVRS